MSRKSVTFLCMGLLFSVNAVSAADWTTYRGGNDRAGATDESIATPLGVAWSLTPPAEPRVAYAQYPKVVAAAAPAKTKCRRVSSGSRPSSW